MTQTEPGITGPAAGVGEAEASEVYRAWSGPLERFLLGVTGDAGLAHDAMQAGWSKLLPRWGSLRPEARRSWLFTTCYREVLSARRREGTRRQHHDKLAAIARHAEKTMTTPDAQAEHAEEIARLRSALKALPDASRAVVTQRLAGKTFQQSADALGLPLSTAISRMHAAMRQLRQAMDGDGDAR